MISQINQSDLLKEFIKTLFASKPVFPGVLPRQWGKRFTDEELYQIYRALKSILKHVDPYSRESMIREFEQFEYAPQYIHGYISRFWREIVELMENVPTALSRYQSKSY